MPTTPLPASALFDPQTTADSFLLPVGGVTGDEATDRVLVALETARHLASFAPVDLPEKPDSLGDDEELYNLRRRNAAEVLKADAPALRTFGAWFGALLEAEGRNAQRLTALCWAWSLVRDVEGTEPEQAAEEIRGFVLVKYGIDLTKGLPSEYPRHTFKLVQRLDVCSASLRHGTRPKRSGAT